MSGSINKVIIVGNLGADPEIRRTQDGRPIANLSVAAAGNVKPCTKCGRSFQKPPKVSDAQWSKRRFCSKRCAGMKRTAKDAEIIAMYMAGHSSTEISKTIAISAAHVLRVLKANGVEIRPASENKKLSHARSDVKVKLSNASRGRRQTEKAKEKLRSYNGQSHHGWRAGLTKTSGGYLQFTSSEANGCNAGKLLHRVVAEWLIGRPIREGEHVHHIDGNKLNNDPNNLEVMKASDHVRLHALQRRLEKRKASGC